MIIFPLFPAVLAMFLNLTVEELIAYRIFQIFIYILIIFQTFKIFEKIGLNNNTRNYIAISIVFILLNVYCIAEYNILSLLLMLIIINIEFSNVNIVRKNIFIGLLSGLIITTKQSIGIVTLISTILVVILSNNRCIEKIKSITIRVLFAIIPVTILIIYLMYNNAIEQFWNYTILGLRDFTQNKLSYTHLIVYEDYIIRYIAIFIPFVYMYIIYKNLKCRLKNYVLTILTIYGLAGLSIMIPITDASHFIIANILPIITLIYLLNSKNDEDERYINKITITINVFSAILIILNIVIFIYNCVCSGFYKHYKYINTFSNEKRLSEVVQFIQENPNTYIIDATAAMYMVPADRYNGILDMILVGNIGINGKEKVISQIKKLEEGYILADKDSNWQNIIEIIEYVEKNYELIGVVADFNVYKINNQASF